MYKYLMNVSELTIVLPDIDDENPITDSAVQYVLSLEFVSKPRCRCTNVGSPPKF
jgi:hypothetical protein